MIINCIADLHGYFPYLEGGDILIIAGDCTSNDSVPAWNDFFNWLDKQKYRKRYLIAGNHDNFCKNFAISNDSINDSLGGRPSVSYLCDSGEEFCGLKIWGSPWTTKFVGINPHCCAFTVDNDKELQEKYDLIPNDIDILITHNPPFGILDKTIHEKSVGSRFLLQKVLEIRPKLHVFGHIHEDHGHYSHKNEIDFINASHVNERYNPVNKPIRIVL